MKAYKTFDAITQTALILILAAGFISGAESMSPGAFLAGLGLLQIISLIIHAVKGPAPWKAVLLRKFHLAGTALVFLLLIIAFTQGSSGSESKYDMGGLGTLMFAALATVVVVIFYTVITWIEWWRMKTAE